MGPLEGVTIIELAGIGPGPFAGMMLADMGARIIRIDRLTPGVLSQLADTSGKGHVPDIVARGRESLAVNLKDQQGIDLVLDLIEKADGLIEGFRPGVAERLGLGPDVCLARNPQFVYGRMTGWGQDGPMAHVAGHDINYISLSGALAAMGRRGDAPVPPLNLVGDYGGGGLMLAYGVVCALLSAKNTGKGQVVDASMVDGSAALMAQFFTMTATGFWKNERGVNLLDTGAPFYEVYETSDGKYMSVGPIEPQFYAELVQISGIDADPAQQYDPSTWPELKQALTDAFKTKTRDEWTTAFDGSDACVAPVLDMAEAPSHPHNIARGTFVTDEKDVVQPAPAPRFSGTPSSLPSLAPEIGADGAQILTELGVDETTQAQLRESGVIG